MNPNIVYNSPATAVQRGQSQRNKVAGSECVYLLMIRLGVRGNPREGESRYVIFIYSPFSTKERHI